LNEDNVVSEDEEERDDQVKRPHLLSEYGDTSASEFEEDGDAGSGFS
jgi:hypothetical protein